MSQQHKVIIFITSQGEREQTNGIVYPKISDKQGRGFQCIQVAGFAQLLVILRYLSSKILNTVIQNEAIQTI